eukprot:389171-Alexandrium_andersonii.AAC.1
MRRDRQSSGFLRMSLGALPFSVDPGRRTSSRHRVQELSCSMSIRAMSPSVCSRAIAMSR